MKKLILPLAILAGIVIFGAPYLTGKVAESETRKLVDVLNQSPLEYGSTEILSYERGFRSTKSSFRYTLPSMLSNFGGTQPVNYSCNSKHGITGIDYSCKLIDNEAYTEFVNNSLGGKDPVSMSGSASLFGGLEHTLTIDAIEDFQASDSAIDLTKTEITVQTNKALSSYKLSGHSDGFSILQGTDLISVGKLRLSGDLEKSDNGLYIGDTQFNVTNLTSKMGNKTLELNKLEVKTETEENGDNIDSSMSMHVEQISTAASPFESIEDVNLEFSINGVNTAAFVEYQTFSQELQREFLTAMESDQEPNFDPEKGLEIIPILEKMLNADLIFDSALSIKLNGEPNTAKLKVGLLEAVTLEEMQMLAVAPEQMLKKFDVQLKASLDKGLVDTQPMLASVGQSPIFEPASSAYQTELSLGKEIKLNDKAMTLEELQTLIMTGAVQTGAVQ